MTETGESATGVNRRVLVAATGLAGVYLGSVALGVVRPADGFENGMLDGVTGVVETVDVPAVGMMAVLLAGDRLAEWLGQDAQNRLPERWAIGDLLERWNRNDDWEHPAALPGERGIRNVEFVLCVVVVPAIGAMLLLPASGPARAVAGFVLFLWMPVLVGLALVHAAYVGATSLQSGQRWPTTVPEWDVVVAAALLGTLGLAVVLVAAGAPGAVMLLLPFVLLVFGPLLVIAAIGGLGETVQTAREQDEHPAADSGRKQDEHPAVDSGRNGGVHSVLGSLTIGEFLSGLLLVAGTGFLLFWVGALLTGPLPSGDLFVHPYVGLPIIVGVAAIVAGMAGTAAVVVGRWGRELL